MNVVYGSWFSWWHESILRFGINFGIGTRILLKFIIYPSCERALKNGRVTSKIFRKLFLNFTFDQGSCLISDFARPNSKKAVLLQNSLRLGDLRPRTHLCFYGIFLMILWKKNLAQNFVVLSSVLQKLWSYKVLNPAGVTSCLYI